MSGAGGDGYETFVDGSGRVHVTIKERSRLDLFASRSYSPARYTDFVELVKVGLDKVSRGQIAVGSSISAGPTFTGTMLLMEINVIGYMGALRTIVDRGVLSARSPNKRFKFDDVDTWTAVGIEARQIVDGLPNSTFTPDQFSFQGTGLFWS